MIRPIVEQLRGLSWVGIIGSLTLHALFVIGVWVFVGMSMWHEAPDIDTRMVRLVAGERDTPSGTPKASAVARRAAAPRAMAKRLASRPVTPPSALPMPAPSVAPEPAIADPEPVAPPVATAVPDPVAGSPLAAVPAAEPGAEQPAAEAPEPSIVADAPVETGPEDGRAFALEASAVRPDLARLQEITSDATVTARAEAEPFVTRREVFEFLLDNLQFAAHVTRALRVARYRAWRTAEGLIVDDGAGTRMNVSVVQATSGARVIHAQVQYRQRMLPEIHCQAVVMIEYDTKRGDDGRDLFSAAVTSYVKVESTFVAALVKLASTAVTDKAALESRRLVRNFARVSRAIEENPTKVWDEVRRSPDVPQAQLEEFRRLLGVQ